VQGCLEQQGPLLTFVSLQEDEILRRAVALHEGRNWKKIGEPERQRVVQFKRPHGSGAYQQL
jgi:hypothetical protein